MQPGGFQLDLEDPGGFRDEFDQNLLPRDRVEVKVETMNVDLIGYIRLDFEADGVSDPNAQGVEALCLDPVLDLDARNLGTSCGRCGRS